LILIGAVWLYGCKCLLSWRRSFRTKVTWRSLTVKPHNAGLGTKGEYSRIDSSLISDTKAQA